MLSTFSEVTRSNINDGAANTTSGSDNDVVVFSNLESVKRFASGRFVKNSSINGIRNRVVNKFTKNKTITTFVEDLHSISRNGQTSADIGIAFEDLDFTGYVEFREVYGLTYTIDMARKLAPFIFIDGMTNIRIRASYGDFSFLRREYRSR